MENRRVRVVKCLWLLLLFMKYLEFYFLVVCFGLGCYCFLLSPYMRNISL